MPIQEDNMNGSIFVFLKRFVEQNYDYSTWVKLLEQASIDRPGGYQMHEMYPTQELETIVATASDATGLSVYSLHELFWEFLVPDLLLIYKKYINPSWRTYEMLLYTEESMHGAVRNEDNRATPPVLSVKKVGNKTLIIDYHSKRRMAGVAIGIIKGIAQYYHESELVTIIPVTQPEEERVQIKVEFMPEAVPVGGWYLL